MENDLVNILFMAVPVLGLWLLLFVLYRSYSVDSFREQVFALRGDMFDAAAGGLISFEDPAYRLMRHRMNGVIRYAHRFTLIRMVLLVHYARRYDLPRESSFMEAWEEATAPLPGPVAEKMDTYRDCLEQIMVRHLLICSPEIVMTIVGPLAVWLFLKWTGDICKQQAGRLYQRLAKNAEDMNTAAITEWDAETERFPPTYPEDRRESLAA